MCTPFCFSMCGKMGVYLDSLTFQAYAVCRWEIRSVANMGELPTAPFRT